jgi:hypothetical protein
VKRFQQVAAALLFASLLLLALLAVALLCSMLLAGIVGTLRGIAW